ncbi:hypothetical protein MTO96_045471, partial [Rhipicephalus appendiculatus]
MFLSSAVGTDFRAHTDDEVIAEFKAHGLLLVALKSNNLSSLMLFRKRLTAADLGKQAVVTVKNAVFGWLEMLKQNAVEYDVKPAGESVWLVAGDAGTSGILGLTNCLLQETGGRHVRCVFDATPNGANEVSDFSPRNTKYAEVFQRDLLMNVYRNGHWGSFKYLSLTS